MRARADGRAATPPPTCAMPPHGRQPSRRPVLSAHARRADSRHAPTLPAPCRMGHFCLWGVGGTLEEFLFSRGFMGQGLSGNYLQVVRVGYLNITAP